MEKYFMEPDANQVVIFHIPDYFVDGWVITANINIKSFVVSYMENKEWVHF